MTVTSNPYAAPEMKVEYGGPDRAVILQSARMKPYNCVICKGESDGRPFVDFNLDLEWYGALYICGYCFVMVSNKLGYASPSQYSDMQDHYTETLKKNLRLVTENEQLRGIVGSLLSISPDERDNLVVHWDELKVLPQDNNDAEQLDNSEGQPDTESDEQVTVERSYDVSSPGSNESAASREFDL